MSEQRPAPSPIEAEDKRMRDLSAGERDFFSRFPFHQCLGTPDSWHMPMISLHDYVLAISQLSLESADLVLDIGCGPGWVSEFAALHGLRVASIDVAQGALIGARERIEAAGVGERVHLIRADAQRMPFADGSFQAIICIASLHHVEQMERAVAEMARILRPDGEAILIEPGEGHSEKAHSRQAIDEHGTLEQDVLPEDVFQWASAAGFAEFHVIPQYFAFPAMRWNIEQWRQHRDMARGRRPGRSAGRLARLWHLFKLWWNARSWREAARQQLPAEWLFHLHFDQWMTDHSCYLLRRSRGERPRGSCWAEGCQGAVEPLGARLEDNTITLNVRLTNTGQALWRSKTWSQMGQVRLGLMRLDAPGGDVLDLNFVRFDLPADVPPGKSVQWELKAPWPGEETPTPVAIDLVSEQVKWFQTTGPDGRRPEITVSAQSHR